MTQAQRRFVRSQIFEIGGTVAIFAVFRTPIFTHWLGYAAVAVSAIALAAQFARGWRRVQTDSN